MRRPSSSSAASVSVRTPSGLHESQPGPTAAVGLTTPALCSLACRSDPEVSAPPAPLRQLPARATVGAWAGTSEATACAAASSVATSRIPASSAIALAMHATSSTFDWKKNHPAESRSACATSSTSERGSMYWLAEGVGPPPRSSCGSCELPPPSTRKGVGNCTITPARRRESEQDARARVSSAEARANCTRLEMSNLFEVPVANEVLREEPSHPRRLHRSWRGDPIA
mmetsp:Transcript_20786/g.67300  ORF Transcript_20786/g.67300 Transcript_20786/m.67300 type:complete len:228 (-) Transcript_20786:988-1671(-)